MTERHGKASAHRRLPVAAKPLDEPVAGSSCHPAPINPDALLDQVLERTNLQRALKQVRQNKGAPGIDGMTVEQLPGYLKEHWPTIREQLVMGRYRPRPVRRVDISKGRGKTRPLGIPSVLDRFIQQAIAQVVRVQWEPHFHPHSYGFRPNRSAHQAVRRVHRAIGEDYGWVVARLKRRTSDASVLRLINCFLKAGVLIDGQKQATMQGVPQGGPLSPVLANVVDWELDRRGHRFVRYADDCTIMVQSRKAGERVMASVTRYVSDSLRLTVNPLKSAVDRPWKRSFLGFTVNRRSKKLQVAHKALDKPKDRIRERTCRTRGKRLDVIVAEL